MATLPGLMKALVGVMLQQRPGDAVVRGVVQQDALSWLVWCGAGAQGAAAAEAECELKVPVGDKGDKRSSGCRVDLNSNFADTDATPAYISQYNQYNKVII